MQKLVGNEVQGEGTLQKKLLLHCLMRLGENVCFRCNQSINSHKELTIDHKERHEGDPQLFWDINNIAVSHFRCNARFNGASEKHWITNGVDTKLIYKSELIPNGWKKGRRIPKLDGHPRYHQPLRNKRGQFYA